VDAERMLPPVFTTVIAISRCVHPKFQESFDEFDEFVGFSRILDDLPMIFHTKS
jgi:hypothetical protein